MKGMNYHDYIWDLGGTLLDNYGMSTKAFVATLADFGLTATYKQVYDKLRESTDTAISYFVPNCPAFREAYKKNEAAFLEKPILFAGAREVLEKIVAGGGRNFLVSHRDNQVLEILDKTKIASLFTEVVTASNGSVSKPDPASMLYLKKKYALTNALVIGDRKIDVQAGQAAGFDTVLVDGSKSLIAIINEGKMK